MYNIGIDLGGTNIKAALLDMDGNIIERSQIPTGANRHYSEIIKDMATAALQCMKSVTLDEINSIGIGTPGAVDQKNGVLVYSNNINFKNVPMRAEMQKYINKPVYIDNDANCAALGEFKRISGDVSHFLFITLGTGVGGGIVIDKKLYTGFNGSAGELGHISLISGGYPCTCGRKGCVEAYASVTALIRQTKEAMAHDKNSLIMEICEGDIEKIGGKTAFLASRQGDKIAKSIVDTWIGYVGQSISNYVNIFQPEYLFIGGAISKEGDYLLNPIKDIVNTNTYSAEIPQTTIQIASLGNDAGLIGAAFLL